MVASCTALCYLASLRIRLSLYSKQRLDPRKVVSVEKETKPKEVLMSLRYGKSYPPKRIEDNRSRFEQEKDHDWDTIRLMRHMLFLW